MRLALGWALALVVVAIGPCGGDDGSRLSDRELEGLVLQLGDLPPGYEQFASGATIGAELNPALGGESSRFGRQNGWTARYRRANRERAAAGALTFASTVDVFGRGSRAGKYYEAVEKHDETAASASGLTAVEVPRIGDEARGLATARPPRGSIRTVSVTWRDGRFVASLLATGFADRLRVEDVLAMARRQERRIAAAR